MFGWGVFFFLGAGPCAGCLLSRTPQPVHRPPPSVLLQNNIYCFGPCCSWCGRPQAPGGAGVEQGQPQTPQTSPNVSYSPNSQRPWCFGGCPRALLSCRWQQRLRTCPSTSCSMFFLAFPTRVLVLTEGPRLAAAQPRPCPIQQPIPSLKNNIFSLNHLWHVLVQPTPQGGHVDSAWYLLTKTHIFHLLPGGEMGTGSRQRA